MYNVFEHVPGSTRWLPSPSINIEALSDCVLVIEKVMAGWRLASADEAGMVPNPNGRSKGVCIILFKK